MNDEKIISREAFLQLRQGFRDAGKTVVLCHGVFDLLHYGHIEHLREAKEQGDILVVSVTAARYVNKGPGRPYFNDHQRMAFLASLEIVDYVILSEAVTVHEVIRYVQPDIYAKGQEYAVAENDVTGNIGPEQAVVEEYGGQIYFTQGVVYSSTKLLNNFFEALPDKVIRESRELIEKYGADLVGQVRKMIDDFSKLKVLVVGDIILDDYIFCRVQGLTSKDNVMSTRYEFKERYLGGSLAIARHLAGFVSHVTMLSMMGPEADMQRYISRVMESVQCDLLVDPKYVTPVKTRFLKRHPQRQEYDKLFSINQLLSVQQMREVDYTKFYRRLESILPDYDLVVVCDYGHGLLDDKAIRIIEKYAKHLAVNCQTNSSNYGMNLITKYHRVDSFVVDERELRLSMENTTKDVNVLLPLLMKKIGGQYAWVTLGADGALGITSEEQASLSAVTLHVKDTIGAGDAFYSLAAICAAVHLPVDISTLLSNIAGAIKTNLVGNSKPIDKISFLKFLSTVLNV